MLRWLLQRLVAAFERKWHYDASYLKEIIDIVERWGPRAVVTLAFAITTARMYPTVKYAMGHGQVCSRVSVGGEPIAIDRELSAYGAARHQA